MKKFEYGKKETEYLSKADSALGEAIKEIGKVEREIIPDLFSALVQSIISQQITSKAAQNIWERFKQSFGEKISPEDILKQDKEGLRGFGVSGRKAEYILCAAKAFFEKETDGEKLKEFDDDEIVKKLCAIKGVGVWTAQMLMIFSLERKDVLSFDDFGIRKGLMVLHGLEKIDTDTFEKYKKLYSPYGTTASLYLWEIAKQK